jgi:hypothetical protein
VGLEKRVGVVTKELKLFTILTLFTFDTLLSELLIISLPLSTHASAPLTMQYCSSPHTLSEELRGRKAIEIVYER